MSGPRSSRPDALGRADLRHHGTRVPLGQLVDFAADIERAVSFGDLVLVAVGAAVKNPVAVKLAQATDAAILCVVLNSKASDAQRTIDAIGNPLFLGTLLAGPDIMGHAGSNKTKSASKKNKGA